MRRRAQLPGFRRWPRAALVALLVLISAGGAAAGYLVARSDEREPSPVVRGSSTVEFDTSQEPGGTVAAPATQATTSAETEAAGTTVEEEVDEPWPTYGYDAARTHVAPPFANHRPPYRQIWMLRSGNYIEFPPTVAYGRVYLAQLRGRFFAIDADTGKVQWQKRFTGNCTAASPTVADGIVYQPYVPGPCTYGSREARGFLIAMDAETGKERWRFPVSSESTALVVDEIVYFGSWDHNLYALNARTGKQLWSFQADDELNSAPAYAGGTIYIGSDGSSVYAVDAKTGQERWHAQGFSSEYFYATPTIAYGRVFIGNTDGTVYAFGARTGNLLWSQNAGTYVYTAAAVWNRTVYVGSYDGNFYAFDAATGDLRWTHDAPGSIHGAPTVLDGLVYFATCGTCGSRGSRYAEAGGRATYALDARTGALVWQFPDGHYSPIVADEERVYLAGSTRLYALQPCGRGTGVRCRG
jgi:outer membrane protein assembly factor BamB